MGHNYKNYAHLEGVVNEDAVVIPTDDGDIVTFTLAVKETTRNFNGDTIKYTDVFNVEVGRRHTAHFIRTLKKGTSLMLDAKIRLLTKTVDGVPHQSVVIDAHRVHSIDWNGWRRTPGMESNTDRGDE